MDSRNLSTIVKMTELPLDRGRPMTKSNEKWHQYWLGAGKGWSNPEGGCLGGFPRAHTVHADTLAWVLSSIIGHQKSSKTGRVPSVRQENEQRQAQRVCSSVFWVHLVLLSLSNQQLNLLSHGSYYTSWRQDGLGPCGAGELNQRDTASRFKYCGNQDGRLE